MGLAFQKLNQEGTTAYEQLQKLQSLIAETQKLNFPDLYKMARMFAPANTQLTPVFKTWSFLREENNFREFGVGERYFGTFHVHHNLYSEPSGGGSMKSDFVIYDQGSQVAISLIHMQDNQPHSLPATSFDYVGFADWFRLFRSNGGKTMDAGVTITMIGFKIGEVIQPKGMPVHIFNAPRVNLSVYEITFDGGLTYQTLYDGIAQPAGGAYAIRRKVENRIHIDGLDFWATHWGGGPPNEPSESVSSWADLNYAPFLVPVTLYTRSVSVSYDNQLGVGYENVLYTNDQPTVLNPEYTKVPAGWSGSNVQRTLLQSWDGDYMYLKFSGAPAPFKVEVSCIGHPPMTFSSAEHHAVKLYVDGEGYTQLQIRLSNDPI